MSLSCSCDYDDCDFWYSPDNDFSKLKTKRSRRCCSCKSKIAVGAEVLRLSRYRSANSDIEERIYGDEVEMAAWYLCEKCGGLYMAVQDLGMCCDVTENIAKQIRDYMEQQ